jgi:outer membrane protein assembly factor BamB
LSGTGTVVCAKTGDGSIVWTAEMSKFGGRRPGWGYCESVLVDGDKVVCTPGGNQGAVVALNKLTGELLWQSTDFKNGAQYASIIVAEHNGKRQYLQLTHENVVGLNADDGKQLWSAAWHGRTATVPTPIFHDGHVYITSGYGSGCKLVKLEADGSATDVYDNKTMVNHHGGVIRVGDYLYGYSDGKGWICQNFKTGEMVWNERAKLGKGCLTCADGRLYLLDEKKGTVALIEPSPEGYKEHGRFTLDPQTQQRSTRGAIWTHPVVANGKLFLRDQELLFCFDVRRKLAGGK